MRPGMEPPPRLSRSTSLQDSEKLECSASWEALDWTDIEPITRPDCSSKFDFLLESEVVVVKVFGVVLVNIDEAGTLLVTTFRLIFISEGTGNIVPLGTIPLASIEKCSKQTMKQSSVGRQLDKFTSRRLLQVIGKDMRVIMFGFRPRTKQRGTIYDALLKYTRPTNVRELYVYNLGPSKFANSSPKIRLLNEYFRVLGKCSNNVSGRNIEEKSYNLYNDHWRITDVNSRYTVCATYPFALLVPKHISDEEIIQASNFRARSRFPVVSWVHPETKAALARSSQPLIGFMNMRSNADEKLVSSLCAQLCGSDGKRRKLYITDARPRKNSLANSAMGGGSESSANYLHSEVVFFGIDNIHAMRESFSRLRDYLDTHGANSSDGISSFLRHGDWSWSGGNLSSMSASVGTLGDSGWLIHVQSVLAGSAWIAAHIVLESASVLVHCSDGWDRTSQLVALANLLLDPYYRTLEGFQALVEKDWLAFGHPFADRIGMPTTDGVAYELPRQSSGLSVSTPVRQTSVSVASQSPSSHSQTLNNSSPIFVQWVDCVSQLLRIYPFAFEFSSCFLVDLLDLMLSCRFGNFLCNSEKERQQAGVFDSCGCLWAYMDDLRSSEGSSHSHYNSFYDPQRHDGPLLPPAAALAPTLWPQFHLRWACPSESRIGEIEIEYQNIAQKIQILKKEKETAERTAIEATTATESLAKELQKEKKLCSSATNLAKKATKEAASMRRAIESLGCKITFSTTGDCIVDIENNLNTDGHSRVCETTCPLRPRDGPCRWPEQGCVQFGSQLVGFKANFEAFDRLSIYDTYFQFNPGE